MQPRGHFGAYTATKAAQLSVAEAMRVELRGTGIAVTTVHPVTTATEFFRAAIRLSGVRPSQRRGIEGFQSADAVAAAIVRSIEQPRPEVWPHRRYRLLMGLTAFAPRVVDRSWPRGDGGNLGEPTARRSHPACNKRN